MPWPDGFQSRKRWLLPGSEYDRLRELVASSPDYKVVYREGDGMVAKYVGEHAFVEKKTS